MCLPCRDWPAMRILRSLTGTLPPGKVSVMFVPTQCWEAETQTTHPSSATSPDSPDGGWCVTGEHKILKEGENKRTQ